MTNIVYKGKADRRVLSAADLKSHGVEFTKTTFNRGEAQEVDEAVAEVLISNPKIFGKFELADAKQPELTMPASDITPSGTKAPRK